MTAGPGVVQFMVAIRSNYKTPIVGIIALFKLKYEPFNLSINPPAPPPPPPPPIPDTYTLWHIPITVLQVITPISYPQILSQSARPPTTTYNMWLQNIKPSTLINPSIFQQFFSTSSRPSAALSRSYAYVS